MKNKGFLLSLALHTGILLMVVWMSWTGYHQIILEDPVADCSIPLEVVDSADVSMAPISKPKVAKPADQKREQDPSPPDEKQKNNSSAIEEKKAKKKSDSKKSLQMEELDQLIDSVLPDLEFENAASKPKPKTPKKVHQGKKQKGDSDEDFMKVLKDMSADEQKGPSAQTPQTDPHSSSPYGAASIGPKMAISLTDRIKRMLEGAWRIPMRAHDGGTLVVMVNLHMLPDGHVKKIEVMHSGGTSSHPAYRLAVESALRAIQSCSPLPLPKDQYAQWKNFQFRFIRQ